jgi:hypothetical protein
MNPITKQQIQEDVKLVYNKLNKSPTLREYIKHGEYSVSTCKRLFGSWKNTLKYSVGETNLERKENVTKECSNCFKSITVNHCEVKEHNKEIKQKPALAAITRYLATISTAKNVEITKNTLNMVMNVQSMKLFTVRGQILIVE